MPLHIVRNDITRMEVDAIVNSTNMYYKAYGGADYAIHKAAGEELEDACRSLKPLEAGNVAVTPGFHLPCKYIIHTVAKKYEDGDIELELLGKCYEASLDMARKLGCSSLAFPLIASGIYNCPKDKALKISMDTISGYLLKYLCNMDVYIVVYDRKSFEISRKVLEGVEEFIDDHYIDERRAFRNSFNLRASEECYYSDYSPSVVREESIRPSLASSFGKVFKESSRKQKKAKFQLDESFSEMLFRKIDESKMKDSECYNRANVSRQVFSKIRSNNNYIPVKTTILALAVALKLDIDDTKSLLEKAGYALSRSQLLDVIVEYYITNKIYDINEINMVLFDHDQSLLGSKM